MSALAPVVLLVDDSTADAALVQAALEDSRVRCDLRSVRTVDEAIAYLEGKPPHRDRAKAPLPSLVLLDLQMPGKNGIDFLRWLRARGDDWHRVPVVMLTTSHDFVEIRACYDAGANSFLVKTTGFNELAKMLELTTSYWLERNRYA